MSAYTLRLLAADGRAVAEKSPARSLGAAVRAAAVAQLRHEAAVLEVARHPGVVRLDGLVEVPGDAHLRTQLVSGRSVADVAAGELSVEEVAGVAIAVATTVADLHDRGVVHGRLDDPAHVLLPPAGPPVLCGFGRARLLPAPAGAADTAGDVAAIGGLLIHLLGDTPSEGVDAATAAVLTTLARRALGVGSARPTARSLAAGLRDAVPDAPLLLVRLPAPSATGPDASRTGGARPQRGVGPRLTQRRHLNRAAARGDRIPPAASGREAVARPWHDLRLVRATASGLGGTAALVAALVLLGAGGGDAGLARPELAATPEPQTRPQGGVEPAARPQSGDPTVVVVGGRRFRLGRTGDLALVVARRCPSDPVAAVIDPSAGVVTAFDRWAEPGEVLAGRVVARGGPTSRAGLTAGPEGCAAVELEHPDGSRSVVGLDPGR